MRRNVSPLSNTKQKKDRSKKQSGVDITLPSKAKGENKTVPSHRPLRRSLICIRLASGTFGPQLNPAAQLEAYSQTESLAQSVTMEIRLAVFAILLLLPLVKAYGSCRQAKLCCAGRDSSCVVQKAPINTIIEDLNDKPCYCDHACLKVGDCCHDFKDACGVSDCEVSDWGPWSSCNVECGTGTMARERTIIRQQENGGKRCPELTQKRGCMGTRCESKSVIKAHRETALILPSTYSQIRTMNSSNDIRKNLRLRYPKDPVKENSEEYCIVFEVSKVRKACDQLDEDVTKVLTKGAEVCVSCEVAAMRKHLGYRCNGHGVHSKPTRWAALSNPDCHGRWIRKEKTDHCNCHSNGKPDFIFV